METDKIRIQCQNRGVDADELLILGRGSSCSSNGRYGMSVTRKKEKEPLFAVQFCKDKRIFVVWNLKRQRVPVRTKYSISGKKLDVVEDNGKLCYVEKNIEYSGWNKENVIAFYEGGIPAFIDEILLKTT